MNIILMVFFLFFASTSFASDPHLICSVEYVNYKEGNETGETNPPVPIPKVVHTEEQPLSLDSEKNYSASYEFPEQGYLVRVVGYGDEIHTQVKDFTTGQTIVRAVSPTSSSEEEFFSEIRFGDFDFQFNTVCYGQ